MNPFLSLTLYSLIFLALLTVALFLFILLRRFLGQIYDRRFRRICQQIEAELLEAIRTNDQSQSLRIAIKYSSQPRALATVLVAYAQKIKGSALNHLKLIFKEGLKRRVYRDLHSIFLAKKIRAIRLLVYFGEPADVPRLFPFLNQKPILRLVTIHALSRAKTPEAIKAIFTAWEKENSAHLATLINILSSLGPIIEPYVQEYLRKELSCDKLASLVELVGLIPLRSLWKELLPLATHSDKEVRIKVARALGRLLIPESYPVLLRLLEDEAWEVQAQAAKSLGKLKNPEAIPYLSQGLTSPFFHVRRNSAYALAMMGEEGKKVLEALAHQNKDHYAADVARMVLEEMVLT
ncbi:MAG: HEAT repeat domain-containing protein [Candidatus Aminicenantes bacterium]|nr:HEAT repeat domain-containing protein [Candidatus Aminicenantes bacterium]